MLKSFVGGLASQTKLYRVKQGRERGSEVILTNGMFFRNDLSSVCRECLPASYRVCCLSLIARYNYDI